MPASLYDTTETLTLSDIVSSSTTTASATTETLTLSDIVSSSTTTASATTETLTLSDIVSSSGTITTTETLALLDTQEYISFYSPTSGEAYYKSSANTISFYLPYTGSTATIYLYKGTIGSGSLQETIVSGLSCTANTMTYEYSPSSAYTNATDYYLYATYSSSIGYSSHFKLYNCTTSSKTETVTSEDALSGGAPYTLVSKEDSVVASDAFWSAFISNEIKSTTREDRTALSYNIKFYIKDQNNEWVDFTDRLEKQSKYKLSSIGSITHSTESKSVGGVFLSSLSDVTMDNSDGFWDTPNSWEGLKTIYNNTAVFSNSKNGKEKVLTKNKCRVVVESVMKDGSIREDCVGVFRISGFSTDSTSGLATLGVESLSQALKDAKADKCKNGKSWYETRSIIFLIRKLLELEYGDKTTGELPASFHFPNQLTIPTYDGERALSSFGRPPEKVVT